MQIFSYLNENPINPGKFQDKYFVHSHIIVYIDLRPTRWMHKKIFFSQSDIIIKSVIRFSTTCFLQT